MRPTRILAIDGGGVRGVIPATILAAFEALAGEPIASLFDLIVGTSTGGIIALGLTTPDPHKPGSPRYTASQLAQLYIDHGHEIFTPKLWRRLVPYVRKGPYPTENLDRVLQKYFGDALISEAIIDVAVTAYNIETRRPQILSRREAKIKAADGTHPSDYYVRDVAKATSAAPTYFPPVCIYPAQSVGTTNGKQVLLDGGLFANNPAFAGFVEGLKIANTGELGAFILVSIGTGTQMKPYSYKQASRWGLAGWARRILDFVFDGTSDHTDERLGELLKSGNYKRFQVSLDEDSEPLDNATKGNINQLVARATSLTKVHSRDIADTVRQLQKPILKGIPIFQLASHSPIGHKISDDIIGIAQNSLDALNLTHAELATQVQRGIGELLATSSDWANGEVTVSGLEYRDLLVRLYERAQKSVRATVFPDFIRDVWPLLRDSAIDAHRRSGASVTRILVLNKRADLTDDLYEEMRRLSDGKFEVRVYFDADDPLYQIPLDLQKAFTIVDDGAAIGIFDGGKSELAVCQWQFNNYHKAGHFVSTFQQLYNASIPWTQLEK